MANFDVAVFRVGLPFCWFGRPIGEVRNGLSLPTIRSLTIGFALLAAALSACTTPPVVEFRQYRDTFNLAQDAARTVLADFASTKEAADKFNAAHQPESPKSVFDQQFDPMAVKLENGTDVVAVRLLALSTLAAYNEAMLALVEGNRDEVASKAFGDLGANVQTLVASVGGTVPGLGALLPIGQTLIGLAQKETDRQAFVKGLRDGYPIVKGVTEFLIEDTRYYALLKRNVLEIERNALGDEAAVAATSMVRLAASHKAPSSRAAELTSSKDEAAQRMVAVIEGLGVKSSNLGRTKAGTSNATLPFGQDAALRPYDDLAKSQMDQFVMSLDAIDRQRLELENKLKRYRDVLANYVLLLRQVESTLLAVSTAPQQRQDLQAKIRQLMPVALQIKDTISSLKAR